MFCRLAGAKWVNAGLGATSSTDPRGRHRGFSSRPIATWQWRQASKRRHSSVFVAVRPAWRHIATHRDSTPRQRSRGRCASITASPPEFVVVRIIAVSATRAGAPHQGGDRLPSRLCRRVRAKEPGHHEGTAWATITVSNNRRQNNRMNLTRSASETDGCGPCRLSVCCTGLGVSDEP